MSKDPALHAALEEFGRVVQKPVPPGPQHRNLFHALTEGGDADPPPTHTPAPLRNVNPNQFALPGMEGQSHPLARHLTAGVHFDFQTDHSHGDGGQGPREPYEHTLTASLPPAGRKPYQQLGSLSWAGSAQQRRSSGAGHYPGEVTWVGRHPAASQAIAKKTTGLMTDMYKAGHELNMGQSTVPVHSPDRTEEGEAWSAKTGTPALRPARYDFDWSPPKGIHPHEQQRNLSQSQFKEPGKSQPHLPGLSRADDIWHDVQ